MHLPSRSNDPGQLVQMRTRSSLLTPAAALTGIWGLLLLGIELVKDRATKEPATAECAHVLENCRDMGLLLGKGGLYGQTIRFSPPMCLHEQDADFLLDVLNRAFSA